MYTTRNNLLIILLVAVLILLMATPMVTAQDNTPSPENPIVVTIAPVDDVPVITGGDAPNSTVDTAIVFVLLGVIAILGMCGTALVAYLVKLLGNSVKTEQLQGFVDSMQKYAYNQLMTATARTPQTWDDSLAPALANFFGYNPAVSVPNRTPIPPAVPSIPSRPDKPSAIVRIFGAFDPTLTFEHTYNGTRRVIYVPINTAASFENRDGAGKEYPYPSVNVNGAYGVRYDIAHIAGAWGWTILETLVRDVQYRVTLEYSAEVHGDKKDSLSDWLWHELIVGDLATGVNQGVSNGARHTAQWSMTGTGLPVMITPRLRAQWASAGDMSNICWHQLTIEPVS